MRITIMILVACEDWMKTMLRCIARVLRGLRNERKWREGKVEVS